MENKKGLEALQRTLLIMNYDNGKTLSENSKTLLEQTLPFYSQPVDYMGRKDPKSDYVLNQGGPMGKPQGAIDAKTLYPNGEPKLGYPKKLTVQQVQDIFNKNKNPFSQPLPTNLIDKFKPGYWKGKPQPQPPTEYKGSIISSPGTKLPRQPWGYYLGKLGNYDDQNIEYKADLKDWAKLNDPQLYNTIVYSERALDRRSIYGDVKVPEGFSPFTYDEYLKAVSDEKAFLSKNTPQKDPKKWEEIQSRKKKYGEREDFPAGISEEDFNSWSEQRKEIKSEIEKFKSEHKKRSMREPYDEYFSVGYLSDQEKAEYNELKQKLAQLDQFYGYDSRNMFDKFWDDYGTAIQIGIAVVSLIASWGASSPAVAGVLGGARVLSTTAKGLAALDLWMNVAVGTYQLGKGDTKEAIMSYFFAFLPKIHGAYGALGKYFKTAPSVELTASIANKLAKAKITTLLEKEAFVASLPLAEREIARVGLSLPPKVVEGGFKTAERLIKSGEAAAQVEKTAITAGKVIKGLGKFALKGAIDMLVLHQIQNFGNEIKKYMKKICPKCGIKTDEEIREYKTYLDSLSPLQLQVINSWLLKIEQSNFSPEQKQKAATNLLTGKGDKFVKNTAEEIRKLEKPDQQEKIAKANFDDVDDFLLSK